jgi:hypothetical protein
MFRLLFLAVLFLAAHRLWRRRARVTEQARIRRARPDRDTYEVTMSDLRRSEAEAKGWKVMDGGE